MPNNFEKAIEAITTQSGVKGPYQPNWKGLIDAIRDWSGTGGGGGGGGGTPGEAATIEVGTTTTLNPGQDATVTNSGTENAAIFNFGIPRGEKGEDGAPGTGISLQGSLDYVGPPVGIVDPEDGDLYIDSNGDGWAYDGADWTNVGQIQGPPGPPGPQGDDSTVPGPKGDAATITVGNTNTLAPGSSATVVNTGDSSAVVLDFGIPKGDPGDPVEAADLYLSRQDDDDAAGNITFKQNIIVDGSVGIGDSSPLRSLWVNLPSDTDEVNTAWFGSGSAGFGTGLDISSNHSENLVALNASGDQAKDLVFKSGNSETMRIDTIGNVGIGTGSPTSLLQTLGSRDYSGTTPALQSYDVNFKSGEAVVSIGSSNGIPSIQGQGSGTGYNLSLAPNAGNVGIGTTGPSAKLEVQGPGQTAGNLNTNSSTHLLLSDTGTASGNGGNIVFAAAGGNWKFASIKGSVVSGSDNTRGDLVFSTRTNNTDATLSEKMRIMANGNIGVGTLGPSQMMELRRDNGGGLGPALILRNSSGEADTACSIFFSPNTADDTGRAAQIRSVNQGTTRADLRFYVANGGTPRESFKIDAAGSVFSANGSNGMSADPIGSRKGGNVAWGTNANAAAFNYYSTGDAVMKLGRNAAGDILKFYVDNSSAAGAFGVGAIVTDGTNISIQGEASDYRIKTNVQPFTGASALVQALNPVTYEYTDRGNGETRRGFIAHELQELIPEAVFGEKDATERLGNLLDWDGTILQENIPEPTAEEMTYEDEIEVTPRVEATQESEEVSAVFQTVTRTKSWVFTKEENELQSLDLSKMVPVLATALKEALDRIDALEQRLPVENSEVE